MVSERTFRIELSDAPRINEIAEANWKMPDHPLGPGVVNAATMQRRFGIYGALRMHGFHEAACDMFCRIIEDTAKRLLKHASIRHAKAKDAAFEAQGHIFFEELYLRLEAAQIPKHVCERLHITVDRQNMSGDYYLAVRVTMLGQPGWERNCQLETFPTTSMVNDILMLA